jgi:hypothetical protein
MLGKLAPPDFLWSTDLLITIFSFRSLFPTTHSLHIITSIILYFVQPVILAYFPNYQSVFLRSFLAHNTFLLLYSPNHYHFIFPCCFCITHLTGVPEFGVVVSSLILLANCFAYHYIWGVDFIYILFSSSL